MCIAADVLLWRNKKISAGVLAGATAVWVLFEWLNYHFLSLICFALIFVMVAQFVWSNASGVLNKYSFCLDYSKLFSFITLILYANTLEF